MYRFPLTLFPPLERQPMLAGTTVGGGPAINGPGQSIDWSAGGWWVLGLGGFSLLTPDERRSWLAWQLRLSGGSEPVIVQFPFADLAPWRGGIVRGPALTTFGDGTRHGDGRRHSQPSLIYELAADLEDGATTARIKVIKGERPTGGFFGLTHADAGPRTYLIEGSAEVEGQPDQFDVDFGPPARGPASAGDVADFETMSCVMTSAGAWPTHKQSTADVPLVTFIEDFSYLDEDEA